MSPFVPQNIYPSLNLSSQEFSFYEWIVLKQGFKTMETVGYFLEDLWTVPGLWGSIMIAKGLYIAVGFVRSKISKILIQ